MKCRQLVCGVILAILGAESAALAQNEFQAPKVAGNLNVTDDGTVDDWAALAADPFTLSWKGDNSAQPVNIQVQWAWDDEYLYTLVKETTPDDDPIAGTDKFDWLSGPDGDPVTAQPWASDSVGFYDTGSNGFCCGETGSTQKVGPWTQWWVGLTPTDLMAQANQVRMQARGVTDGGQIDDFLIDQDSPADLVDDENGTLTGTPDRQIGEDLTFPHEDPEFTRAAHTAAGQNVDLGNAMRAIELRVPWDRLRYQQGENPAGDDIVDVEGNRHTLADIAPGYKFRNDPLLVDGVTGNTWQGQTFPGGVGDPRQVPIDQTTIVHLVSASLVGDFNANGVLDAADLNLQASAMGTADLTYDLNSDAQVDILDRRYWVEQLGNTWMGDSNLDGFFNSSDLVLVFTAGKYETGAAALWEEGDWDGDGKFTTSDFVEGFSGGGYEAVPTPRGATTAAVPEPSTMSLALIAVLALGNGCRQAWRRHA